MKRQELAKFNIPEQPGVYFFKKGKDILYIGKATSLKDRTKSYFASDLVSTRGMRIVEMVFKADSIEFETTNSVLEALILESNLIKKHQPYYNAKEKDDKSYYYVVITKEDFPRVLLERGRNLKKDITKTLKGFQALYQFGPYPNGEQLREALKIVRKIFQFRDKCLLDSARPCFNAQIGLCPGVCVGKISKQEYAKIISRIKLFFEGNTKKLVSLLTKEMKSYAREQKFEQANQIKRTLFSLQHIQDVSLIRSNNVGFDISEDTTNDYQKPFRIEAYDIAHLFGDDMVGVMTVIEDSIKEPSNYRKFKIKGFTRSNDTGALDEVLRRRLAHSEWQMPDIVVIDGSTAQLNVAKKRFGEYLAQNKNNEDKDQKIDIVAVIKNDAHKPERLIGDSKIISKYEQEILKANAEAHRFAITFHRNLRRKKLGL